MSDSIEIKGIKAYGYHGVLPDEKVKGQEFIVDVILTLDLQAAGESDDLTKTIDYSKVATIIAFEIENEALNLIEALAQRISNKLFEAFVKIEKVIVTVHKPKAPVEVSFQDISVTIERNR